MNTPTKPGFYWVKFAEKWTVVQVWKGGYGLMVDCIGTGESFALENKDARPWLWGPEILPPGTEEK